MAVLNKKNVPYSTEQAAVWIVTDNATYGGLGSLTTRSGNGIQRRTIDETDTARAMRLCAEAGIDIKRKNVWRDRGHLLRNLSAGELKRWLEEY